ncbi:MAG: LysR family transcriptional regulator [Gammaproteobacteria bacterium]
MNLLLLRSFLAVADAGTITEAADRMAVTQSALSRRLQQLEEQLGAVVLARGRQGAELTEVGRLVETEARQLTMRYDALRRKIAEQLQLHRGTVRIGGGATVTAHLLPRAIAEFQGRHPGIRFQLKEASSREVAADVAAGQLELGLVTLPVRRHELNIRSLLTDEIVLVCGRDHALARKRGVRSEDLAAYGFVGFEAGSAIRMTIDAALRSAGVELEVVMELRSIPSILEMVLATGNPAFVSALGVIDRKGLKRVPVKGLSVKRKLGLATRASMPLSVAASAFESLLLRQLGYNRRDRSVAQRG